MRTLNFFASYLREKCLGIIGGTQFCSMFKKGMLNSARYSPQRVFGPFISDV
jgi:hypothetical protein